VSDVSQHPYEPPRRRSGSGVSPWLVAALLVAIAALLLGYFRPLIPGPLHNPDAASRPVTARGDLAGDEKAAIELFRTARDSVVHITSLATARDRFSMNLFEIPRGTGSGFVWDDEGHVVTNYHVIADASGAQVRLADGSTYSARLVGGERDKDVAVLKIDVPVRRPPPILIGTSEDLQVGQKVFAIGNPFGLDQTLTTGVISGLGREIEGDNNVAIRNVIQTDAAINPGNSGGPLLDSAGRLIGMNTAIYSPSGAYAGVGFAIPVDDINRLVPQIIRTGRAERIGLGIRILSDDAIRQLVEAGQLPRTGVLVLAVVQGGAAAEAGLRPTRETEDGVDWGDLIVGVDGEAVESTNDLFRILGEKSAGDTVTITVLRNGDEVDVKATLRALPTFDS
jgi:S1-C subfamily serine protease